MAGIRELYTPILGRPQIEAHTQLVIVTRQSTTTAALTPSTKAQLVAQRALKSRTDFGEFVRFVGGLKPASHQSRLISKLQNIGDRPEGKKLLIVMPPGAGKTTIVILFLAWMIGRYPSKHYGLFSYADQVGWERSRAIRDIIEHNRPYRLVFPEIVPNKSNWGVESFRGGSWGGFVRSSSVP